MARTIAEIKDAITADFMSNEDLARAYDFTVGDSFASKFSVVSIESIIFYIVAASVWVLEGMMDLFRAEVDERITEITPGRAEWYANKTLAFMKGMLPMPDTDRYDTTGMDDDAIVKSKVVKHAVAVENETSSVLTIKVAGEVDGKRCPLDQDTEAQLMAYIREFKYAGVHVELVNKTADVFNCEVTVYYDPQLTMSHVQEDCLAAIKNYIENLPFNGGYTNMALVDVLQVVAGVRNISFKSASSSEYGVYVTTGIDGAVKPAAGYFSLGEVKIKMEVYNG